MASTDQLYAAINAMREVLEKISAERDGINYKVDRLAGWADGALAEASAILAGDGI